MLKNIADNRLDSGKKKLNEIGWVGIKAVGKWDVHPDLRETQWCKEEHEIKKWIELREQKRCCHGQSLSGCRITESWAEGCIFVWHHLEDMNKHTPLMPIIALSDSAMYLYLRLWGKKTKNKTIINASKEDWNQWKMSEAVQVQSLVSQPIHFSLTSESR